MVFITLQPETLELVLPRPLVTDAMPDSLLLRSSCSGSHPRSTLLLSALQWSALHFPNLFQCILLGLFGYSPEVLTTVQTENSPNSNAQSSALPDPPFELPQWLPLPTGVLLPFFHYKDDSLFIDVYQT